MPYRPVRSVARRSTGGGEPADEDPGSGLGQRRGRGSGPDGGAPGGGPRPPGAGAGHRGVAEPVRVGRRGFPPLPVRPGQRHPVGRDGPRAGVGGAHPAGDVRPGPGPGDVRARPRVLPRRSGGAGPGAGRPGGRRHADPVRAVRRRGGRLSVGSADARAVPDAAAGRAAAGDGVHAGARAPGPLARPDRRVADEPGVPDRAARLQPGPGRVRAGASTRPGGCDQRGEPGPGVHQPELRLRRRDRAGLRPLRRPPARRRRRDRDAGTIRAAPRSSWSA